MSLCGSRGSPSQPLGSQPHRQAVAMNAVLASRAGLRPWPLGREPCMQPVPPAGTAGVATVCVSNTQGTWGLGQPPISMAPFSLPVPCSPRDPFTGANEGAVSWQKAALPWEQTPLALGSDRFGGSSLEGPGLCCPWSCGGSLSSWSQSLLACRLRDLPSQWHPAGLARCMEPRGSRGAAAAALGSLHSLFTGHLDSA